MELKVGLIGLGRMGINHERILNDLPGVKLIAAYDSNFKNYSTDRSNYYKESLNDFFDSGLDYCVIASSSSSHHELAMLAASHNIPVLIEKPLALDVKTSFEIYTKFKSLNLIAGVGHIERFNPVMIKAKNLLDENFVGELIHISSRRQNDSQGRIFDSGVIFDLATHDIDLACWLSGENFIEYSVVGNVNSAISQEDSVAIIARLTSGSTSSHLVSRLSTFKERVTTITGTLGVIHCNTLNSEIRVHLRKPQTKKIDSKISQEEIVSFELSSSEPLKLEHENFRDALFGKSNNYCSLYEGHKIVEVAHDLTKQLGT
jgi:UDP-N-acetylglucosamine 3-dehydrogenase